MTLATILLVTTVLGSLYTIQFLLALVNANEETGSGNQTVLRIAFCGAKRITRTWTTIGIAFIIPVFLSWLLYLARAGSNFNEDEALFTACVSMLLVLVTLELSIANELYYAEKRVWFSMILFALGLDLSSLFFLNFAVRRYATMVSSVGWVEVSDYIIFIAGAAFLASFTVILFARTSREL